MNSFPDETERPAESTPESPPTDAQPSETEIARSQPTDVLPASDSDQPTDLEGLDSATLAAPSFPNPLNVKPPDTAAERPELDFKPNDKIDDFEILALLGKGAFGGVYLARQVSLDRRVALKVAANRGSEGRTMARLEHDHIVQVFSETVDASGKLRLLCMQLAPGAPLDSLIRDLHEATDTTWHGADYLAVVDQRAQASETFDASALRDRELIGDSDDVQTTAWVGARLAEAIAYAHQQGVLHRDIKPANILVNQYGRPLLADFNISASNSGDAQDSLGGTLAFMAPEHLDAFNRESTATAAEVDERSDLYSLALVIHELLTGKSPFTGVDRDGSRLLFIKRLAELRRQGSAIVKAGPADARKLLHRTIARGLEPNPADRFATGEQFAAALKGCRAARTAEREQPPSRWLTRAMQHRPLMWLILVVLVPQVISSLVNISYNTLEIVSKMPPAREKLFWGDTFPSIGIVGVYNAIVYPLVVVLGWMVIAPVFRAWRDLESDRRLDAETIDAARRRATRLPLWLLAFVAAGWLPGGVLFPLLIDWLEGPIDWSVYAHFLTSFTLSGLIAAAYSLCGLQYLVLRVMYPRMWVDPTSFRQIAREELAGTPWRLRFIQRLAGSIPLVALVLILTMTPDEQATSFRVLGVGLALLGMIGFQTATMATSAMSRTLVALTGREE